MSESNKRRERERKETFGKMFGEAAAAAASTQRREKLSKWSSETVREKTAIERE